MTISKTFALIAATVAALSVGPSRALSQYFPSSKMTAAFQEYLDSLALSHSAAFVSSCFGPEDGETAVLVIPIGSDTGTLALLSSHESYNGAGVKLQNGRIIIFEGGGGEWSRRKLQFFANKLASSDFRLESGDQLRALTTMNPEHRCPRFVDARAPSVEKSGH